MNVINICCSYCHTKWYNIVTHPGYGWCLICHGMINCPNCNSLMKVTDYDEFKSIVAKLGLTGHEHKCRLDYPTKEHAKRAHTGSSEERHLQEISNHIGKILIIGGGVIIWSMVAVLLGACII